MADKATAPSGARMTDAEAWKFQIVFMVVGVLIIVAGLWWLYLGDAPYHPDGSPTEVYSQSAYDR